MLCGIILTNTAIPPLLINKIFLKLGLQAMKKCGHLFPNFHSALFNSVGKQHKSCPKNTTADNILATRVWVHC